MCVVYAAMASRVVATCTPSSLNTERSVLRIMKRFAARCLQGEQGYLAFVNGGLYFRSTATGNQIISINTNTLEVSFWDEPGAHC